MRIPEVTELGHCTVGSRKFTIFLVDDEFDGSDDDHDSDHARGQCDCRCQNPMDVIRDAAVTSSDLIGEDES